MPDLPSAPAGSVPAPSASRWRGRLDDLADRIGVEPVRLAVGAAVGLIVVVVALVAIGGRGAAGAPTAQPSSSSAPVALPASAATSTTLTEWWVDVTGAVAHPGVYRMPPGARITDAVGAAGGPAADAQLDAVNLAARVTDGQRIYVPRMGESPPIQVDGDATAAPAVVDLNAATLEQLDTLPGVGPATARAIADWRQQHGRFRTVDDLLHIRGLGKSRVDALRPKVTVQ